MRSNIRGYWPLCGTKVPANEIVFFVQIIVIYTVIGVSIFNLSTNNHNNPLWISLLSSCLGYLLPSPYINRSASNKAASFEYGSAETTHQSLESPSTTEQKTIDIGD